MKLKLIAAAVALAAAAPAFALTPSDTAVSNAFKLGNYAQTNGASAAVQIVYSSFRRLCQNDVIAMTSAASGKLFNGMRPGDTGWGNFMGYACTLRPASDSVWSDLGIDAPATAGQVTLFLNTVDGGSITSVIGMDTAAANQKAFIGKKNADGSLNLSACVDSGFVTGPTTVGGGDGGVKIYSSCATEKRQGQGGFSDVEKQMFTFLGTLGLGYDADVVVTPVAAGQSFGIAVSSGLYAAMVAAQSPADGVPSISTREYASLVNQNGFSVTKASWEFLVGAAGADKRVRLCRRQDTSGTQASSNAYFLGNPCAGLADNLGALNPATLGLPVVNTPIVPIDATGDATETFLIVEASGTSGVKDCLNGNNVNSAGTKVNGTNTDWAIGVMSLENNPTATDTFKFIKLDGVTTFDGDLNTYNAIAGNYNFAFQMVLHTHPERTPAKAADLLNAMVATIGNSTVLTDVRAPGVFRTSESRGTRNNSCTNFVF